MFHFQVDAKIPKQTKQKIIAKSRQRRGNFSLDLSILHVDFNV